MLRSAPSPFSAFFGQYEDRNRWEEPADVAERSPRGKEEDAPLVKPARQALPKGFRMAANPWIIRQLGADGMRGPRRRAGRRRRPGEATAAARRRL